MCPNFKKKYKQSPETHYKSVKIHEYSDMRPNLGKGEGTMSKLSPFIGFEGIPNKLI